jgi:anti-sigma B factor antagonist
MQSAPDKMCVCEDDQSIVFQVEGRGTMKQAPALRARAERALADGVRRLHVDLRRCHYMDSTFLGTLLLLMRALRQSEHGEFGLVSPSVECRQLLEKMRLDTVYPMLDLEELPAYLWTDLPAELGDAECFDRVVVQAHQELAATPGAPCALFAELAKRLMQEWKLKRARGEANEQSGPPGTARSL